MSRARTSRSEACGAGFTLIELLVAITLLGLLMAALFGGLQLGARAWETGQRRIEASSTLQIVQQFIRTRLEQAVPVYLIDQRGESRIAFRGRMEEVSFVAPLPDLLGGGLYQFTLGLSGDDVGRPHLGLAWRRFLVDAQGEPVPGEVLGQRTLVTGPDTLSFAYYGTAGSDPAPRWHDDWSEVEALPLLVRLRIGYPADDPRTWPDLLVRPMIDRPPQGLY